LIADIGSDALFFSCFFAHVQHFDAVNGKASAVQNPVSAVPKRVKDVVCSSLQELVSRATDYHMPYGIRQCYLPADTGERVLP